jgi:hypothetical protein
MANNSSSDPNNVVPMGHSVIAQNDQKGSLSQTPSLPLEQEAIHPSTPLEKQKDGLMGPHRLIAGTVLSAGRYKIETLVASGGMGAVYRAIDTRFKRPCAVKEMLNEFTNEAERAQAVEWFAREATLLLDLNHP